ncbi:MAG: DUF4340 domain-containing protein [Clostridia bacterium]|nr:DUF4340 domain-containing protein [Clostridia bacterium]
MKRQTVVLVWAAAILLLVVACFAGIYFVWDQGYTKNEPVEAFSCISTEIEGYAVSDKNGRYSLEKDDGIWQVEGDKTAELDQTAIGKMVAAASKITATGTLSRKDLEKFDISDTKTVMLEVDDRDDVEIRFLGTLENLCAFKVSGDRRIYVMYAATRDILAPKLDALRITDVFPSLAKTDTLPDYYSYTDYDGTVMELRVKNATELTQSKNNRYIMQKPYLREVDDDLFEQQIAVKIPGLKATTFVNSQSQNLVVYGLDNASRATLSFKWNGTNETLYLGKAKDGAVFAMKDNSDSIFTINSSLLEFLQIEPFYILEGGILKAHADNILSLKVIEGENVYNITASSRDGADRRFYINGKAASEDVFEDIVEELADIKFKNELDNVPENTGDIIITVSYNNAAHTQTVSLVKTRQKSYAVFIDGTAEFEVESADVDELMQKLRDASKNPIKMD